MIVNADVKGLEWVGVTFLSQDKVAYQEIINKIDQHGDNQKRFGLPSRLIAKTFVFRLIYGGGKWAYVMDSDFNCVSSDPEFWQNVIDEFYGKYKGIAQWHKEIVYSVQKNGFLEVPSGRRFDFKQYPDRYGQMEWPRTQILNYPVQGFGADLVMLARISMFNRMKKANMKSKLITTIHDSIVVDSPQEEVYNICQMLKSVIEDIPKNASKCFKINFDLPMSGEIFTGPNKLEMELWNAD